MEEQKTFSFGFGSPCPMGIKNMPTRSAPCYCIQPAAASCLGKFKLCARIGLTRIGLTSSAPGRREVSSFALLGQ